MGQRQAKMQLLAMKCLFMYSDRDSSNTLKVLRHTNLTTEVAVISLPQLKAHATDSPRALYLQQEGKR